MVEMDDVAQCTMEDYSIMVLDLPADTIKEGLLTTFTASTICSTRPEGRPGIGRRFDKLNADGELPDPLYYPTSRRDTTDPLYRGSCGEASFAHPYGNLIRGFQCQKALIQSLRVARALHKKHLPFGRARRAQVRSTFSVCAGSRQLVHLASKPSLKSGHRPGERHRRIHHLQQPGELCRCYEDYVLELAVHVPWGTPRSSCCRMRRSCM